MSTEIADTKKKLNQKLPFLDFDLLEYLYNNTFHKHTKRLSYTNFNHFEIQYFS